mmetsp:Transcript_26909/g.67499  ORF Transcript_26909/g.67499 Transcript_26909/m.67499 type:complete len:242 (+) Transcript_26909:169-894(+)
MLAHRRERPDTVTPSCRQRALQAALHPAYFTSPPSSANRARRVSVAPRRAPPLLLPLGGCTTTKTSARSSPRSMTIVLTCMSGNWTPQRETMKNGTSNPRNSTVGCVIRTTRPSSLDSSPVRTTTGYSVPSFFTTLPTSCTPPRRGGNSTSSIVYTKPPTVPGMNNPIVPFNAVFSTFSKSNANASLTSGEALMSAADMTTFADTAKGCRTGPTAAFALAASSPLMRAPRDAKGLSDFWGE